MAHLEGVLMPLVAFCFIGAIVLVPKWRRSRERIAAIEAIRALAEKGQPTPPELMAILQQIDRPRTARGFLVSGLINLAISAAMLFMAYSQFHFSRLPEPYVNGGIVGGAAFPGFIGLVLIGFWFFNRRGLDD